MFSVRMDIHVQCCIPYCDRKYDFYGVQVPYGKLEWDLVEDLLQDEDEYWTFKDGKTYCTFHKYEDYDDNTI